MGEHPIGGYLVWVRVRAVSGYPSASLEAILQEVILWEVTNFSWKDPKPIPCGLLCFGPSLHKLTRSRFTSLPRYIKIR